MNQSAFRRIITLGFFLAVACASVSAQSIENKLSVKIPFDFVVGEQTLPAGKYSFRHLPGMPDKLAIQSADRQVRAVIWSTLTETRPAPAKTTLVFRNYGAQRFLAEVWVGGDKNGGILVQSRVERELAQHTNAKTQTISFADERQQK